jgi:hypothetical protein
VGSVTLLAQKKSCMCWVWNIGSFWEVSVLTDGPRKPKENASAADAVLTILTNSMAMNIAAPAITRIARRLSEIGVPIFCTFLFGAEEERCHTPAPACYSILSMNQLGNQCIPLTSDLCELRRIHLLLTRMKLRTEANHRAFIGPCFIEG